MKTVGILSPSIWILLLLAACILSSPNAFAQPDRPKNVIFFLVDDLGWTDVGCYGSKFYETPAIDQLATEGIRFDNAYSTCHVCSPSRASILTGKYPARTNLTEWLSGRPERSYESLHHAEKLTALPDEEQTLAESLQAHGYVTANYGKAHLNKDPKTYGFDEAITGWVRSYYHPFSPAYEQSLPSESGDYFTDKLTDAALDFIERNKDQPFFVHLEHFSVHDPIQGRDDLVQKYQQKLSQRSNEQGPDYILEPNPDGIRLSSAEIRSLESRDESTLHQEARVWWVKQKQDNVQFAAMVEATDQSLQRIRQKLHELDLSDDTIIIFTSDNGGMAASNQYRGIQHDRRTLDTRYSTSNLPLRGAKGWNYEGGVRVPLIVHWPGQGQPGMLSNAVVTGTDFYPTLLEMLGLPTLPDQHVDGQSFVPALASKPYDRGPIYWHFPHYSNHGFQSPGGAVRDGRYKLLEYYENGTVQLFDLEQDIGEQRDLAETYPEIANKLRSQLHAWREEVDAKMPYPKTATSVSAPGARVALPNAEQMRKHLQSFAPGWSIRDWGGPEMRPGLRARWQGRSDVLLTHPANREKPCVMTRAYEVPSGSRKALQFSVSSHPKGDWILAVRINKEVVLSQRVESVDWQQITVDLAAYSGQTVSIELENRANDWAFEAAYWHNLRFIDAGRL